MAKYRKEREVNYSFWAHLWTPFSEQKPATKRALKYFVLLYFVSPRDISDAKYCWTNNRLFGFKKTSIFTYIHCADLKITLGFFCID